MFMSLLAVPRIVSDSERTARLKHERNRGLGYLRYWWCAIGSFFEFLIRDAVWDHCETQLV